MLSSEFKFRALTDQEAPGDVIKAQIGSDRSVSIRRSYETNPMTGVRGWRVDVRGSDEHEFDSFTEALAFAKSGTIAKHRDKKGSTAHHKRDYIPDTRMDRRAKRTQQRAWNRMKQEREVAVNDPKFKASERESKRRTPSVLAQIKRLNPTDDQLTRAETILERLDADMLTRTEAAHQLTELLASVRLQSNRKKGKK